jgi:hypothetical protein
MGNEKPMNKQEWLALAAHNRDQLKSLLSTYHPINRLPFRRQEHNITASAAESACEAIRVDINKRYVADPRPRDPLGELDRAIDSGDIGVIQNLLNEAWFGVPESTDCWRIPGFTEAVELLEDPPDPECKQCGKPNESPWESKLCEACR